MDEALPTSIIACLEELGRRLVAISREHRDGRLEEMESAVLGAVRQAMPGLLAGVVAQASGSMALAEAGLKAACPGCGGWAGVQSWRGRTVLTVCGRVNLSRPWYVCPGCGRGWSPVDESLGLEKRARLSPGVSQWVIGLGASSTSFGEAAATLERLAGVTISPETVRVYSEGRGALLEQAEQSSIAYVAQSREAAEEVEPVSGQLLVETDGVMVRYLDGWHEVRLGMVAGHEGGRTRAPSYVAAREGPDEFGARLLTEAARRGALEVRSWRGPLTGPCLAMLPEVVVLGDGAHWIWKLAESYFGTRTEIVDFYHATEHLWAAARVLYGEGAPEAAAWAQARKGELLEGGAAPVQEALEGAGCKREAAEVIHRERGYFRTNAPRMDYPAFRRRGLPIGSGAIESAAKHLVQSRLKRPGARWSQAGAQAILALRCRITSTRPLAA